MARNFDAQTIENTTKIRRVVVQANTVQAVLCDAQDDETILAMIVFFWTVNSAAHRKILDREYLPFEIDQLCEISSCLCAEISKRKKKCPKR